MNTYSVLFRSIIIIDNIIIKKVTSYIFIGLFSDLIDNYCN